MRPVLRHVFLDLDGTLADSADGIVRGLREAVRRVGGTAPEAEALRATIGRPLRAVFLELLGDEALAGRALEAYLEDFERLVLPTHRLYAGIVDALEELARAGFALHVVTAKRHGAALRTVAHLGLESRLRGVYGISETAGRRDKSTALADALRDQNAHPARATMIGDRRDDVEAARRNGVRAVAVGWGYGSLDELHRAGPDALVHRPAELCDALRA